MPKDQTEPAVERDSSNHPGPPTPGKHIATGTSDVELQTSTEAVQGGGDERSIKPMSSSVSVSGGVRRPKPKPSTKPIPMSGKRLGMMTWCYMYMQLCNGHCGSSIV